MNSKVTSTLVTGMIMRVDNFGNLVTNLPNSAIKGMTSSAQQVGVLVGKRPAKARIVRTYSDGRPGELILLGSSSGFVELSLMKGSATRAFLARPGGVVELRFGSAVGKAKDKHTRRKKKYNRSALYI
jgi:S-adenosylmethionine hydrolase